MGENKPRVINHIYDSGDPPSRAKLGWPSVSVFFSAQMGFQLPLPPARFENCCQGLFANTLSILQFALFIIHFAFKLSVFLFGPIKF